MMREATVFAPGHLTGLFQICIDYANPAIRGARGSGISLSRGVVTRVKAEPSPKDLHTVSINGEETKDAVVSENVLSKFLDRIREPFKISIEHEIQTPQVAGFGSSGGGAISLALALNQVLQTGLSRNEAARIAHVAEIECGTGLGSVFAANCGGFGVLYKPGTPGIGASISYERSSELQVIYLYFGPIPTKKALADPELRRKINEIGGEYVDELYHDLTPERFLKFSRQFTEHLGLVTPKLRHVFDIMDRNGVTFTMAMFGEVAYTLVPRMQTESVLEALGESFSDVDPVVCEIDSEGTRFLE